MLSEAKRQRLQTLAVGQRVQIRAGREHDPATKGMEGKVSQVSTPALGLKFPSMKGTHKWYTADELDVVRESIPRTRTRMPPLREQTSTLPPNIVSQAMHFLGQVAPRWLVLYLTAAGDLADYLSTRLWTSVVAKKPLLAFTKRSDDIQALYYRDVPGGTLLIAEVYFRMPHEEERPGPTQYLVAVLPGSQAQEVQDMLGMRARQV